MFVLLTTLQWLSAEGRRETDFKTKFTIIGTLHKDEQGISYLQYFSTSLCVIYLDVIPQNVKGLYVRLIKFLTVH